MSKLKDAVILDVTKDGTDIFFKLTVCREIEEFFKQSALQEFGEDKHIQISKKWFDASGQGLPFYKNNTQLSESIDKYINNKIIATRKDGNNSYVRVANDFGRGLYSDGRINVAILRVVGATKGITIKTTDLIAYEEVKVFMEQLAVFVREFYVNFVGKKELKTVIQFTV